MVQSTAKKEAPAPVPRKPTKPRATRPQEDAAATPRVRDAAATRKRILDAAIDEFAERGFSGARIDSIAQRSSANMRMIYHYYGNKEELYVYVLDHVYEDIRKREASLNLANLAPFDAMMKLFNFTFSHFEANPHIIALWTGENLQKGLYLSTSPRAATLTSPLVDAIRETLVRGEADRAFRPDIDPLQLYVSMVALSYFHLSNAYTLSAIFQTNLQSNKWRSERRRHAQEMLAAYLLHMRAVEKA
jgi:TetR/AcrR family transcriptional regulator